MKRHDQIYNLLTMTMGLPLGRKKSNGRELVRRISGEQKGPGNKFLSVRAFSQMRLFRKKEREKAISSLCMAKMIKGKKSRAEFFLHSFKFKFYLSY